MKDLERFPIAYLPTALDALPRLSHTLGGPALFIKRDDLTGLALGGNKTRKLEYLLADARRQGARTLITTGAVQSNHCRQTAAAAAKAGLACVLVLTGEKPAGISGNLLLDALFNANLIWATRETRERVLQEKFDELVAAGEQPYLIPYGGSNTLGAASYAYAIREMISQGCQPDWIVFPTSSGGTQAGMLVGARLFGFGGKILGISVDEKRAVLQPRIAALAEATAETLGAPVHIRPEDVLVRDEFLGGGYGVMGDLERDAVNLFARTEGVLVDPVYTGRAAGGLFSLIRSGFFRKEERVLFWHTGGMPAIFADAYRALVCEKTA